LPVCQCGHQQKGKGRWPSLRTITNNELIKFRRNIASDFLRASRLDPFMGNDSTSPIVRMSDLAGDGKEIRIPLVTQLTGNPASVSARWSVTEETLDSYGMPMWADWARNAVANNRAVAKESSFSAAVHRAEPTSRLVASYRP
jgi:hypothetical protein